MALSDLFGQGKPATSTTSPYAATEPMLGQIAGGVQDWFNGGGSMYAPMNRDTQRAFSMTRGLAGKPPKALGRSLSVANSMLNNGGMTTRMRDSYSILGNYADNDGMTAGMTEAAGYLKNFADGSYQEDPRLQKQLDINANRASNAAATRFGGGRYGSVGIGSGVGTAVAEANNGIMLQSNENARNRQLQASGQLGSLYQNAASLGLNAAQAQGSLAQAGAGNMMQAASMVPALNNARYDGASRMAGLGDYQQNRADANTDYARLNQYLGGISPIAGLGRTTTSTRQSPSLAQGILGGMSAGAGIGNALGIGGGWGAIGGGILGAFS